MARASTLFDRENTLQIESRQLMLRRGGSATPGVAILRNEWALSDVVHHFEYKIVPATFASKSRGDQPIATAGQVKMDCEAFSTFLRTRPHCMAP
jgi:hypothetical protein